MAHPRRGRPDWKEQIGPLGATEMGRRPPLSTKRLTLRVIESTRTLTPLPAEAALASVAASIGRDGRLSAGDERLLFEILGAAQASPSAETLAAAAEARRLIIE